VDEDGLSLGSFTEDGVEINVSTGGNLLTGETINGFIIGNHCSGGKLEFLVSGLVKDINGALVYEHFFDREVLELDGIILLLVNIVEIDVGEGDGGIRRLWWEWVMWLMDWILRRCFFRADEVEPSLAKPHEIVLIVPRRERSAWLTLVRAGC